MSVVKTKLVSVFATRFSPNLDTETLSVYLKEKRGHEVVHSRFSSFKVSAECNEAGEMYNQELWPEGAFVRRCYELCKAGVIGSNTALAVGGMSVPGGAMCTN